MNERFAASIDLEQSLTIHWSDRLIDRVESQPATKSSAPRQVVAPGLIDLQINGFAGINFGDPNLTTEMTLEVANALWSNGVTHFLPTLITDQVRRMQQALCRLAQAARHPDLSDSILGFHLEGPYLSPADGPRGAHPLSCCKDPDWDEFLRLQEAAEGKIRLMTLAPEREGAIPFIRQAVKSGVRIALGHTAADSETIAAAVDAGASMSTHLGNAAHDQLQRHRNYIYDQLASDQLYASLIIDGHHLPPGLAKIFWRAKGPQRCILVSDAVQYAGLPPGIYGTDDQRLEVRGDGFIGIVGEPRLAGSGLMLLKGIENIQRFAGASLAEAVAAATSVPAQFLGLERRIGSLTAGAEASLILFNWNPQTQVANVVETIVAGRTVFRV